MKGSYSDIRVEAATTDPVRAAELMRLHSTSFETAWIEEFEDGQSPYSHIPVQYWCVTLRPDGSLNNAFCSFDQPGMEQREIPMLDGLQIQHIRAETEEQAVKIARDERARMLAISEGIS